MRRNRDRVRVCAPVRDAGAHSAVGTETHIASAADTALHRRFTNLLRYRRRNRIPRSRRCSRNFVRPSSAALMFAVCIPGVTRTVKFHLIMARAHLSVARNPLPSSSSFSSSSFTYFFRFFFFLLFLCLLARRRDATTVCRRSPRARGRFRFIRQVSP